MHIPDAHLLENSMQVNKAIAELSALSSEKSSRMFLAADLSHMRFSGVAMRRFFPGPGAWATCGLLFLVLTLGSIPHARAQSTPPAATASVTDTNVEGGQQVEYQIQVMGGQPNRPPPAPQVEGLTITYTSESQSVQFESSNSGTHLNRTMVYTYIVDTDKAGRYVIPGQDIALNNSATVRTSPVALNVTGSGATTGGRGSDLATFAELTLAKKTAYVGESVPVEVRAYFGIRLNVARVDGNPILNGDGFSAQKFTQPQQDTQVVEGVQFNLVKYKSSIAPVKTGELSLGPVVMEHVVQVPRTQQTRARRRFNDPFNDPFFNNDPFGAFGGGSIAKQVKMQSDPVKLEVKPLPPGAPEDFSGAIGQFKLEVEPQGNPRKVQAGDPVTLHIRVQGEGNFDRIKAPVLTDENGLQTYPATAKFKAEDDVDFRGTKTFEQVVIPRSARTTLPAYRLVYLDPSTGKYVTLETPPVPVKVQGSAATPTPQPNQAAAPAPNATPAAKPTPTPKPEDILYLRNESGRIVDGQAFVPLLEHRNFWMAQLIPLISLLGFVGVAWRNARTRNEARRRAADLLRQQSELVRTLQGEKTPRRDFYSAATRLAQLKAAAASGRPDGNLTAAEVCRAEGLDAATAASVEEIFHRHDELAYSGGRAAQETVPVHERRDVLATLQTVGKL